MQLREIMTARAETVPPDATLSHVAKRMKELDVGSLPVCDGERLCGIITDRDIAIRAVADGRDPQRTHVRDAMTDDVCYCYDDQDFEEAASLMKQRQIRRLPVLNRDRRLVGIVSLGDVMLKGDDDDLAAETVAGVSQPRTE
jgi:CBS domain-containing protein